MLKGGGGQQDIKKHKRYDFVLKLSLSASSSTCSQYHFRVLRLIFAGAMRKANETVNDATTA